MGNEDKIIVTIGRQAGSGGRVIGRMLAEDLGIPFYDKELLEVAARESGLSREVFENHDEVPTNSFLYSLVMDAYSYGYSNGVHDMPIDHKVFLAQFNAIKKIASEGSCVIVGRCADYALEEEKILSVFVHGEFDDRANRIMHDYGVTANKAKEMILKTDKKRSSYYNYYANKRWGAAASYDLTLNSSAFGLEGCVALIKAALNR